MFSVLLVTHGGTASAMVEEVAMIAGRRRVEKFHTIEIDQETEVDGIYCVIQDKLQMLSDQGEVVVLTDFPVGTPFNIVCALRDKWKFIHMTGVNIPLLLGLAMADERENSTSQLCCQVLARAQEQLCNVEELFRCVEVYGAEEKD